MSIRITCITKDMAEPGYPHTAISTFGWIEDETREQGIYTREEMYLWLVNGGHAYICEPQQKKVYLVAMQTETGNRYVRTTRDDQEEDDLLYLPLCNTDHQKASIESLNNEPLTKAS